MPLAMVSIGAAGSRIRRRRGSRRSIVGGAVWAKAGNAPRARPPASTARRVIVMPFPLTADAAGMSDRRRPGKPASEDILAEVGIAREAGQAVTYVRSVDRHALALFLFGL